MLLDESGFLDCNKATLQIMGSGSQEDFCSKHSSDYSPPEQPCGTDSFSLAQEKIFAAMTTGSQHFEWIHQRCTRSKINRQSVNGYHRNSLAINRKSKNKGDAI